MHRRLIGSALRAIAIRGRLRATPSPGYPPLQLHYPHPENRHDGPPFFERSFLALRTHMHPRSAQNGSLPSSDTMDLAASATFLPGNTPLVQKPSQTAFRDVDASSVQHLLHLSHRHPPWPVVRPDASANGPAHPSGSASAAQVSPISPSMASKVDIRFVEAFRRHIPSLSAISRIRNQAQMHSAIGYPISRSEE